MNLDENNNDKINIKNHQIILNAFNLLPIIRTCYEETSAIASPSTIA